jgi:hypothetical protein
MRRYKARQMPQRSVYQSAVVLGQPGCYKSAREPDMSTLAHTTVSAELLFHVS